MSEKKENDLDLNLSQLFHKENSLIQQITINDSNYRKIWTMSSSDSKDRYAGTGKREDYAKELELSAISHSTGKLKEQLQNIRNLIDNILTDNK